GVRLLLCCSVPVELGAGAELTTIEVPPLPPAAAAKLACLVCPDLAGPPAGGASGGGRPSGVTQLPPLLTVGPSLRFPAATAAALTAAGAGQDVAGGGEGGSSSISSGGVEGGGGGSSDEASRVALAVRCLPLAVRLVCGLRAEGRLSTKDIEALGARASRASLASAPLASAGWEEVTVSVIAACLSTLPMQQQVALLQLSALPPAGAGPDTTLASLNATTPAAAVIGRGTLTALQRQGLTAQSSLPGRRTQTVMHSLVRSVVVSALAPALDLAIRPAAEERVAAALLAAVGGWGRSYGTREGGSSVLAAARAAQPEFAELLALLTRTAPRLTTGTAPFGASSTGGAPPSPEASAAAAAGQRLPLETIVTAAKGFNGDVAELLSGLGALPALEAVCEAMSAPAVGLVANRAYKVEMANVYRVHALALAAQGKYEEAQAHGNMCIQLRAEAARRNPNSPAIASANMCLAAALAGMRYFENAEELLRQAVDICVASLGESNPHTAWALAALAAALEAQPTKATQAEALYRRALDARLAVQGPLHPRTIEATLALAACLRSAGRYADAKPLYDTASAASHRVFGEFHANTAFAIAGAATCADAMAEAEAAAGGGATELVAAVQRQEADHSRAAAILSALAVDNAEAAAAAYGRARNLTLQGRHAGAEPLYRRAVELCSRNLPRDPEGRDQATTIASLLALGRCLLAAGKPGEAQGVLERGLTAKVRVLGTQAHPEAAAIARDVAAAALAARRFTAAEPLCRQALAMAQHGVGMESREAAFALSEYGRCLTLQGRHTAAEPILRQALEVRQTSDGDGAAATAAARIALAENLAAQQEVKEAEQLFRQAREELRRLLVACGEGRGGGSGKGGEEWGARELELAAAAAAAGLGGVLAGERKGPEAEEMLKEALEARRRLLGQDHSDTQAVLSSLSSALSALGQHTQAEELLRAELAAAERAGGPTHPNTAAAMNALASCLHAQGRHAEAEPLFMSARNVCTTQLGAEHPNTLAVGANLAACLGAQGRHAEALPLLEAQIEATKRVQGEEHPDVAASLNHLASTLQTLGRLEEAERAARRAVALYGAALGSGHPNSALAANTLALVLLAPAGPAGVVAPGRVAEAQTLLEEALKTCTSRLGPQHPWTQSTKRNLDAACAAAGKR
ncbi:hypothetical protein Agub_g7313, partial [Astrephomene gubernaculifera]